MVVLTYFKNKYLHLLLIFSIVFVLTGCADKEQEYQIICELEKYNKFSDVVKEAFPNYNVVSEQNTAFTKLSSSFAVEACGYLAVPSLATSAAKYWRPLYAATVVIAIDRDQTDENISGWDVCLLRG